MTGKVAAKETKAKVPKQASSEKKTSSNPSYVQMVVKAIVSLTEATSYETTSLRKILEFIHSSFQCKYLMLSKSFNPFNLLNQITHDY